MEIKDYIIDNKIVALGNFKEKDFNLENYLVIKAISFKEDIFVNDYLLSICRDNTRIIDSFKMVNENEDILYKKLNTLSSSEVLKVMFAKALLNKEKVIILIDFDKYFMEKDLFFFKKLFRKLVDKYGKSIVMFSNNVNFMFDLIDVLYLNTHKNVINFDGKDLYNEEIYKSLDMPKIVDFIYYLKNKGKVFAKYTEMKELLKAIYREV